MRTLVIVTLSLALGGCQCGSPNRQQPGSGTGSAGSAGSSGSARTNPPSTNPPTRGSTPIDLPALSGKPPAKTSSPHTNAQLEAISKLEFKGFTRDVRSLDKGFLNLKQRTESRPKIGVTVTIQPCMDCLPMDLEKWKAKGDALKVLLPPELRDRPDTTFESGELMLGGVKAIWTYQVGYFFGKDDKGQPTGDYMNSFAIYYNDGINQLRVVGAYVDDPLASKADLVRAVPRDQLEKVSTAFVDAYAQAWGN